MTQEKLIKHYEDKLSNVYSIWGNSHVDKERGQEYIDFAEGELKAIKEDGIDGLKRYWEKYNEGENKQDISYEHLYINLKDTFEAMQETRIPSNDWWNSKELSKKLDFAKKEGYVNRISHTQVEWADKATEALNTLSTKMFSGMEEWMLGRNDDLGLKMLQLIKDDYQNESSSYDHFKGKVNRWLLNINGDSTVELRDGICAGFDDMFDRDIDWRNGFASVDTSILYSFTPNADYPYGLDAIEVTAENKEMLTKALKDGNITIEGVDMEDHSNKELFNIVDYETQLKEGNVFSKKDMRSANTLGEKTLFFAGMTSSVERVNQEEKPSTQEAKKQQIKKMKP